MTSRSDEHERTLAFAEVALGQIKALRHPATPRHYEIWYTYATGYNPALNQTINDMLARHGTLSSIEIDNIYDTFVSTNRLSDTVGNVGSQVMSAIDQVMAMIGDAAGDASGHTQTLARATIQLGTAVDAPTVRAIVETLVQTASEMERSNKALEARLIASKREITQLQHNLATARNESLTDPLTSLANRKYFDEAIVKAVNEAKHWGKSVSLIMTDIDNFKKFNDSYGHLIGDQVLKVVAKSVKQNVKGQDIAARYGGEEFAVVLPDTVLRSAITLAEHIRRAVMAKELTKRSTGEHLGRITISIGVAALRPGDTVQSLIERADMCLYAAKRHGRNRVISETDPEASAMARAEVA